MADNLTDDEWKARFIKHMIERGKEVGWPETNVNIGESVAEYAAGVVDAYLAERVDYETPEEAADADISYIGDT